MKYGYGGQEIYPVVEFYHDLIPYLAGIREREFYMDAEACAKAWKQANGILEDYYGAMCPVRTPSAAPLSYGHLVSIGAPYTLPEDSEPNVRPFVHSIEDAVAYMREIPGVDFGANDMCRHYRDVNRFLQETFPNAAIPPLAGYGMEGIVTTAVLMRGQDIFVDMFEEPELTREYFGLLNQSIIDFCHWQSTVNGQPPVSTVGSYLCDDFAALVPPRLWDEFVIPYWDAYYSARATGSYRFLHCEGMSPEQLRNLKNAHITRFQPSVSEKLTLQNVKANLDIPFDWLLYAWKLCDMTDEQIVAWVDETVQTGVFKIRTQLGKYGWLCKKQEKVKVFMKAFEKYAV